MIVGSMALTCVYFFLDTTPPHIIVVLHKVLLYLFSVFTGSVRPGLWQLSLVRTGHCGRCGSGLEFECGGGNGLGKHVFCHDVVDVPAFLCIGIGCQ